MPRRVAHPSSKPIKSNSEANNIILFILSSETAAAHCLINRCFLPARLTRLGRGRALWVPTAAAFFPLAYKVPTRTAEHEHATRKQEKRPEQPCREDGFEQVPIHWLLLMHRASSNRAKPQPGQHGKLEERRCGEFTARIYQKRTFNTL